MTDFKDDVRYKARRVVRKVRWAMAGIWLYLLPLPLLANAVWMLAVGNLLNLFLSLGLYAAFGLSGWLIRQATALEAKALSDPLGRAPLFPFRGMAALVAGAAAFGVALLLVGQGFWVSLLFGAGAAAGTVLTYGWDRFGAQIGLPATSEDAVYEALSKAGDTLRELRRMRLRMRNREFRERLDRLVGWGDRIVDQIKEDNRDLKRAREFLNVYLDGAYRVTATYLKTHGHTGDQAEALESRYAELLEGMEREFESSHARLMRDDILDLDVELELLTTQLKQKGMV